MFRKHFFSIRTKVTATLLLAGLVVLGVMVISARAVMLERFETVVSTRASANFISEVVEYYRAYGSWQQARESETFFQYRDRVREVTEPRGRPAGMPDPNRPPRRSFPPGGEPPGFIVADNNGIIVLPLGGEASPGDTLTDTQFDEAIPILNASEQIGLAVPVQRPILSELESQYLESFETAWKYALFVAVPLTLVIGWLIGHRLTLPVTRLTQAMSDMKPGDSGRELEVSRSDELGTLTEQFNNMSRDLARAYRELENSRNQIQVYADRMESLSRIDSLTGIMNRRALDDELEYHYSRACRYDAPLTVALIDIDYFKQVNDRFSHAVGDKVLKQLSTLFTDNIRHVDLVGRYGGEEFLVIFPDTDLPEAVIMAERLRRIIREYNWSDLAAELKITISLGLKALEKGETREQLLDAADSRLYRAKEAGRDRAVA